MDHTTRASQTIRRPAPKSSAAARGNRSRHKYFFAGVATGLLAVGAPAAAQTGPAEAGPIYIWGFQAGCETKPDIAKKVVDRLVNEHHYRAESLLTAKGTALPVCPGPVQSSGSGCAAELRKACPGSNGLVLGGVIARHSKATRIRLWLYDLQTQQQIVRDDYCQQCDPDDGKVVTAHAVALLTQHRNSGGSSETAKPSYCEGKADVPAGRSTVGPLHMGIFGSKAESVRKELMRRIGLKRSSQSLAAPVALESKQADPATLDRLTQGQEGAQVLRIELNNGSAELYLWDQRSRRSATRSVPCNDGCRDDLESISQASAEILDVCFADLCSTQQQAEHRPLEACAAFGDAVCPALPSTSSASLVYQGVDPGLAKRIQIVTGIGLGLGAALSAGLWIANSFVSDERSVDVNGMTRKLFLDHPLTKAAAATSGLTVGLVGLSIPIFYWLEKGKQASPPQTGGMSQEPPPGAPRCPSPSLSTASLKRRSKL